MRTHLMPMSTIWSAAISPVYAPQPPKFMFCGARKAPFVVEHSATWRGDGQ